MYTLYFLYDRAANFLYDEPFPQMQCEGQKVQVLGGSESLRHLGLELNHALTGAFQTSFIVVNTYRCVGPPHQG